jgi:hypothetical protein
LPAGTPRTRALGAGVGAFIPPPPGSSRYSRKIWSPVLLPICTVLLLLALHGLVVQKRPSSAFWLLLLLGAATKLHFSAWLLAVVLVIARVRHGTPCDGAG